MNYEFEICMLTDTGCCRQRNEDSLRYLAPIDRSIHNQGKLLAIIADGMGGHEAGEIASQLAVDFISQNYCLEKCSNPIENLRQVFTAANQLIRVTAAQEPRLQGMGTTATALVLHEGNYGYAHVGDSRLYLLRKNTLYQLSEDHTVVMKLVHDGIISHSAAQHHPDKNIITRALGINSEIQVSVPLELKPIYLHDHFILCSDGLHDLIVDEEIKQIILSTTPSLACKRLIALARERGGHDNISVGVVSVCAASIQKRQLPPRTREFSTEIV